MFATILLVSMTVWDQYNADYVVWNEDNTETFFVQGKQIVGGECKDIDFYPNYRDYYWKDITGTIIKTRVNKVYMVINGKYIEVVDE